jgi:hypothetical protein
MTKRNIALASFLILVVIAIVFLPKCERDGSPNVQKVVYKKGLPSVIHTKGRPDTVFVPSQTKWRVKEVLRLIVDTVYVQDVPVPRMVTNDTFRQFVPDGRYHKK